MTFQEIREECWDIARDNGNVDADRLWPLAEINKYINRTYRDIARKTLCITDTETTSICLIASDPVDYTTYTPGTLDYIWANDPDSWLYHLDVCPYLYTLDPRILKIEEVKWTTRQWKLTHVSSEKWQTNVWWEQVIGLPTEFATDLTNNKIALNYRSETSDTLRLQVKRLPLADLSDDADVPEFRTDYHDFFRSGVLAQMYAKQDADAFDAKLEAKYKAQYQDEIDEAKQAETKLESRLSPNRAEMAFR